MNGYTYFRDGDVLVAKITPCFENGKGALASGLASEMGFGTTELHVLRPTGELDARFLFYFTMSDRFRKLGESRMYGAGGQKRISEDFVEEFRLPLPPLAIQQAIASFLDRETEKIDHLIEKKRRLLELLQEKHTALVTQAVTRGLDPEVPMKDSGVEWIGEIPEHWEVVRLKHLVPRIRPVTYGIVQAGPNVPDGVPYIKTSDMSGSELPEDGYQRTSKEIDRQYARSRVVPGDIVVAIRATVGKALVVPGGLPLANLTQGTARVSPGPRVTSGFLQAGLAGSHTQQRFEALAKGATFTEITLGMLRELEFVLPPLAEQKRILDRLREHNLHVSDLAANTREAITLLREYRTALISSAVTGKVDAREMVLA